MSDSHELTVTSHGERMLAPLAQPAEFGGSISQHHRAFYDDYNVAKEHILQMVGDISDFEIYGRNVLVAVFCRPNITPTGFIMATNAIKEDWWQHKVVLILKMGPGAFKGTDDYLNGMFGPDVTPPGPGDWVVANASSGQQISMCGSGHSRPQGLDHRGRQMDLFEWDGWPCRIVHDENFLGRLSKPHTFV